MATTPNLMFTATVITVGKYAECVHFYRDLLGCSVEQGGEEGPVTYFASPAGRFVILDRKRAPEEAQGMTDAGGLGKPRATLAFHSTDVDAEFERLSAAGVKFSIEPRHFADWNVRSSLCADPDGNPVEIAGGKVRRRNRLTSIA